MNRVSARSWPIALVLALIATPAFAQGAASSTISGVVVDRDGGVVPGATVTATNDATAGVSNAISGSDGAFTIPSLNIGKYTVTVALQGFKTAVLKDVSVTAGGPAIVKATLEVGGVSETVVVEGATAVIQTQSSAASTTLNTKQIASLPLGTRDTLAFITFLPGVQTPSTSRNSIINGLPQSAINITLDGVSIQDNYLKTTDGFFARLSPRLDAVEEVTVTTAGNGADASAQGAAQIAFTTRSGSNLFTGSAYHYYQNDILNANNYFNKVRGLPKPSVLQNQPGVRLGGPIVIPGLFDGRGKAFFFLNYEEFREPEEITTNSNFLTDEAQAGLFRYDTAGGVRTVDLYALAASNSRIATPDPTTAALLNDIRTAALSSGTITPLTDNYTARRLSFQQDTNAHNRYPTVRVDYNLSIAHRLNVSYNFQDIVSRPDTTNTDQRTFPGFPITGAQISDRVTVQASVRSTITGNMVNELRMGRSGGPTIFAGGLARDMWNGALANTRGYALTLGSGLTNAGQSGPGISSREGSTRFIEDRVSWAMGKHNLSLGGTFTQANVWLVNETLAPTLTFSVLNGDPALAMFSNAANFPGSTSAQRNNARDLYALLVGSISAVNGTPRLDPSTGRYVYNGVSRQEGRLREFDFFAQDNWRLRPNLTLNAGLRYMIQRPFAALNNSYSFATLEDVWGISGFKEGCDPSVVTPETCNLFKNGTTPGAAPTYKNLGKGVSAYQTDWNNLAPSIGINWTPGADSGWRRTLLGETGTTSFSAGYTRAFERHGMSDFTGLLDDNPGLTAGGNRNAANGNLGGLPLYFRSGDPGPPSTCAGGAAPPACIPEGPVYPIAATTTGAMSTFDPQLQVPYADTWTVGLQRALGKSSAFEVRYVGTRSREQWLTYDYNEVNILDNGFLNEFRLAQANLYANMAANRGATFAYQGPGTGTSPLPIYLAYFTGTPLALASDPLKYTGTNWTNSNFVNPLTLLNPNPFTPAGSNANTGLNGSGTLRDNAVQAGLPRNFFVANPDALGGARVVGNGGFTKFNGLQTQFRRRLSGGLQFDMNYALGKAYEHTRYSFRVPFKTTRNTGTEGDVTHAYKATVVYELPFGQGRRFANGFGPLMDRVVNGWQLSATARVQSGQLVDLGNVRAVGMTEKDVQQAFRLRKVGPDEIYMWPDDILENTIKAHSIDLNGYTRGAPEGRYFAPANGEDCIEQIAAGYGDCGARSLVVTGPVFRTMDLTISKEVRLAGRKSVQFRFDMLNLFDVVNFTPVIGQTNSAFQTALTNYQITQVNRGNNFGREVQLVMRFNW